MLTADPADAVVDLTRHAVDEWAGLAQLRRYPMAVADAVGRFLAG